MHHHAAFSHIGKYRARFRNVKLPLVLGFLIIAYGAWRGLHGGLALAGSSGDPEQTTAAMAFLCGLYLLLTGLWLASRGYFTPKRAAGLAVMLIGILAGTWLGTRCLAANSDDLLPAQIAFFAGLLVHLLGVLYVRKE
jgi:hypothetical protein